MECTHGKLCTRLTDGLGSGNTCRFADLNGLTGGKVGTVTLGTCAVLGFTGQHGTDLYLGVSGFHDLGSTLCSDHAVSCYDDISILVQDIFCCKTSHDSIFQ